MHLFFSTVIWLRLCLNNPTLTFFVAKWQANSEAKDIKYSLFYSSVNQNKNDQ